MFSPAASAVAQKLGLKKGRANLEEFADTLQALATADRNIVAITSDSRGSGKLAPYGKALPKQIVEVGIAEQNLVGITAGLAACGKKAFGVSPSCFLTARSLEQIKNDICYSNVPGVVVGCDPIVVAVLVPLLEGRRPAPAVLYGALLVAAGAFTVQGWGRTDLAGLGWSVAAPTIRSQWAA